MKRRYLACVLVLIVAFAALPGRTCAFEPQEQLENHTLEHRARTLFTKLRCPVCQNQSIDESDSDIARDLRAIVREKLLQGESDPNILAFLEERYGRFILLEPEISAMTLLLWAVPILSLLCGMALIAARIAMKRNRNALAK